MAKRLQDGTLVDVNYKALCVRGTGVGVIEGYSSRLYHVKMYMPHDIMGERTRVVFNCHRNEITPVPEEKVEEVRKTCELKQAAIPKPPLRRLGSSLEFSQILHKMVAQEEARR